MEDRPQARNEVLAAFSKALREGYGGGEDPELAINLIVRKHNEIIFSSRGAPTEVKNSRPGKCSASGPETTLDEPHAQICALRRGGHPFHPGRQLEFLYLPELARLLRHAAACMHPFSSVSRVAVNPHRDAPSNRVVNEISLRTPDDLSP